MTTKAVLLRYHEIALKGANRGRFERQLCRNAEAIIRRSTQKEIIVRAEQNNGRIILETPEISDSDFDRVSSALNHVFGVTSYSTVRQVPTHLDQIRGIAFEEFEKYIQVHGLPKTFAVRTRRSEKAVSQTSSEVDLFVGAAIHDVYPTLQVSLKNPELTIGIEIRRDTSFVWVGKNPGLGGLPVGITGDVLALLSGGIDSPVAAMQLLKRGARVSFLHFDGQPFIGPQSRQKVEDLVQILNRYQPKPMPLYIVPFGKIQEQIALVTNPKLRTVLYRRMMFRIASRAAERMGAKALVTGDSLGQVASQTLENIATIDDCSGHTVFRPLISMDKEEIISLAQKYGTFDISIRPAADCCTLFADRHPSTRQRIEVIQAQEERFSPQELVEIAVKSGERWLPPFAW
ncbi:tRNA 4-thiouridine(8) synthase ThiI [bacterium]|jgi:thiamine biosynthesis protein ThiI|nr:tRNA 4-thiouridine(8) synthase ThiI [bacterium]